MNIKRKYYFLALSVLPLLFIMRMPQVTHQTQMASQSVMRPFLSAGQNVTSTVHSLFGYFWIFLKTAETQQHNQQVIDKLENKLAGYDEMIHENVRLRELLQLKEQTLGTPIAARVIGWNMSAWQKTFILDKGQKDGLKKDMAVIVKEGLVGRILEVGPTTAHVVLFIDSNGRVSAMSSQSRAHGMIAGNGSKTLKFRYLDLDSGIEENEIVISSGMTGIFPKGFKIGTIKNIERDKDGLHLVAEVEPYVKYDKIEEVLCIG